MREKWYFNLTVKIFTHSKDLLLSKRVGACPLEKTIFKKSSGITSTRNSNYFKIEWYRPPLRRLKARRSFRTPGFYLTVKTIFTLQAQSSLWCLLFLPSGCRKARHKVSEKVHLSRCCLRRVCGLSSEARLQVRSPQQFP